MQIFYYLAVRKNSPPAKDIIVSFGTKARRDLSAEHLSNRGYHVTSKWQVFQTNSDARPDVN